MLWTLADPRPDGLLVVEYPYFETEGVRFSEPISYVAHEEPLGSPDIVHFNHGLARSDHRAQNAGMSLTAIEEHNTVPWNPLDTQWKQSATGNTDSGTLRTDWPRPTPFRPPRPDKETHPNPLTERLDQHGHKRTPYVHSVLPPFPWPMTSTTRSRNCRAVARSTAPESGNL